MRLYGKLKYLVILLITLSFMPFDALAAQKRNFVLQSDPMIAYEIVLPAGWRELADRPAAASIKGTTTMTPIANYVLPNAAGESSVVISALEQPYFITPEDWMLGHIKRNNFTVIEQAAEANGVYGATYMRLTREGERLTIGRLFANGPRLILAEYSFPPSRFEAEKTVARTTIDSFKLTARDAVPMEKVEWFQLSTMARAAYPASWKLVAAPAMPGRDAQATLVLSSEVAVFDASRRYNDPPVMRTMGRVDMFMRVKNTAIDTQTWLDTELNRLGLILREPLQQQPAAPRLNAAWKSGSLKAYRADIGMGRVIPHEIWVLTASDDKYDIALVMLSPTREEEFFTWARNKAAYELVVRSIQPLEVAPTPAAPVTSVAPPKL